MTRYANIAIAGGAALGLCLLGLMLYRFAGFSKVDAGLTIVCIMLGAAQIASLYARDRQPDFDPGGLRDDLAEMSYSLNSLRRETETIDDRLRVCEDSQINDAGIRNEELVSQMRVLESLVQQLADNADNRGGGGAPVYDPVDDELAHRPAREIAYLDDLPEESAPHEEDPIEAIRRARLPKLSLVPDTDDAPAYGMPVHEEPLYDEREDAALLAAVRQSLDDNRIDLYLQPIVTLPQRKTRYYEGLSRLRGEDGEVLLPAEYLRVAENAGIIPAIDNLLLFRCIQVVKRMVERHREIGVFCNISPHSLLDSEFFPQLIEYLQHNRELSAALHFEFSQSMVDSFGPLEHESLGALRELGFTFSMDRVKRLDFSAEALARLGFAFVKVECDLLLNRSAEARAQIHGADLSRLLGRFGIELIVEKIEQEHSVVDLLDYDVKFGQGYLFSTPRPVRGDILESVPLRRTGTG